jgi:TPR repeat protein
MRVKPDSVPAAKLAGSIAKAKTMVGKCSVAPAPRFRVLLGAGLVALGMAGAVNAGPSEDLDAANAAYGNGDYAAALRLLRPLAEQGDAGAQYSLGIMYRNGKGVPQDLGEAIKWYRRAADQGNPFAQYNLGVMYDEGRGVAQSDSEAMAWYRKAANLGDARALYNLGVMYEKGQGIAPNGAQAYMWYSLAAFRFQGTDEQARARVLRSRDRVATKMSPEQLAAAQKMAREWRPN